MQRLTTLILIPAVLFILPPNRAQAATIAFDATTQSAQTPAASVALTLTNTGSTDLIFVGCDNQNSGGISSAKVNGANLTLVDSQLNSDGVTNTYLYYFAATTTVNSISLTRTSTTNQWACFATSYTNARLTSVPDAQTKGQNSSTSMTGTLTTLTDNDWAILMAYDGGQGLSASTGSTLRGSVIIGAYGIFDTNGSLSPAGSHSMSVHTAGTANGSYVMAAFAPTTPASAAFKPWQFWTF